MPKKRAHNFIKQLQGSSSSKQTTASNGDGDNSPSVNERLSELRKLKGKEAAAKKRLLAESVNQRPKQLQRFARLTGLEDTSAEDRPPSLLHLSLKALAESWSLFDEDDYNAFAEVPLRLRLKLLAYISYYGSPLTSQQLEALLQGSEKITSLDLAGLTGHLNLTLKKVGRLIEKEQHGNSHGSAEAIAESWDAETSFETALQPTLSVSRFSGLAHLCLSHPGPGASWRDLLGLAKSIPQVTHLSLAYWPRPTLTPNLATTTVSSRNSPDVTAGGSHYYSTLDQDMTEPLALLRQLSAHLLCLQWLDLEGCQQWIPALAKLTTTATHTDVAMTGLVSLTDEWATKSSTTQSVLTTNWKNLTYIRCAQGWFPTLIGIQSLADFAPFALQRTIKAGIERHLRDTIGESTHPDRPTNDALDVERKRARMWLDSECNIKESNKRIHLARRSGGCKPIEMDFGWLNRDDDYMMMMRMSGIAKGY